MNIIDVVLLLIIGVSVVFAIYRGFLASVLGVVACLISLLVALLTGPKLADALAQNQGLNTLLTTYTDASSLIGDASLSATPVVTLNDDMIETVLKTVSMPAILQDALRQNIRTQSFAEKGLYTVGAYVSATIVSFVPAIAAFLICFFLCFLLLHILINLVDHVFYFPVLKHLNGPASALMGLIRGAAVVCVLLIVIPLIRTALPFDLVQQQIDGSALIPLLYRESLLLRVIAGT